MNIQYCMVIEMEGQGSEERSKAIKRAARGIYMHRNGVSMDWGKFILWMKICRVLAVASRENPYGFSDVEIWRIISSAHSPNHCFPTSPSLPPLPPPKSRFTTIISLCLPLHQSCHSHQQYQRSHSHSNRPYILQLARRLTAPIFLPPGARCAGFWSAWRYEREIVQRPQKLWEDTVDFLGTGFGNMCVFGENSSVDVHAEPG